MFNCCGVVGWVVFGVCGGLDLLLLFGSVYVWIVIVFCWLWFCEYGCFVLLVLLVGCLCC